MLTLQYHGWPSTQPGTCTQPCLIVHTAVPPLFTQPCPGEQWARLCVFTLQGCVLKLPGCVEGHPWICPCPVGITYGIIMHRRQSTTDKFTNARDNNLTSFDWLLILLNRVCPYFSYPDIETLWMAKKSGVNLAPLNKMLNLDLFIYR